MILDFHTHIFSKQIRQHREQYCASDPDFRLLYEHPSSRLVGASQLIAAMDENQVDQAVVFGFPWKDSDAFRQENDYIMDAVARYPQRLIGFSCFDPGHPQAAAETQRCFAGGLAGIGELAFYQTGINRQALDQLRPIMALAEEKYAPVLIHTNEPIGHQYPGKSPNTLNQIYALIKAFPRNRLVLAHWGGGVFFYKLLKREVAEALKNVYVDTAASPFLYRPAIYKVAGEILGADKILFGSDYPLIKPERYYQELTKSGLNEEDRALILGRNAERLCNSALGQ